MSAISLYKGVYDKNSKYSSIDDFIAGIADGEWSNDIISYHNSQDKKDKERLPNVMISGLFVEPKNTGLKTHSGFICIDVDNVDDVDGLKDAIKNDEYLFAAFKSVSGNGLALLFKINGSKHSESFDAIVKYLYEEYGIVCDPSCRNVARRRFVSYDPDLILNKRAKKWTKVEKKAPAAPKVIFTKTDFDEILQRITNLKVDITGDYTQWVRIAFSLVDQFGEVGRNAFHTISQYSPLYDYEKADKQYTYCLRSTYVGNKCTIGTLYYYAKLNNVETYSAKTKKYSRTASINKRSGLTKQAAIENVKKFEEFDEEIEEIFDQVFDKAIDVNIEENLIEAIAEYINSKHQLQYNSITRKLEVDGKTVDDVSANTMYLDVKVLFKKANRELFNTILFSEYVKTYNPLKTFFETNKSTSKGNIDKLFSCIESKMPKDDILYFGKKWLVGIVSAAFGIHSPLSLVLSGRKHGTGKTEFFRRLMPKELQQYYAESKLDAGKDDFILMTQKLLILDDEYGGKSKKEMTLFKEISSKQTFSIRQPYARFSEDLPRLAVLCGTTNHSDILQDFTGNRRVIVFSVDDIDKDKYNSIDKVQLLMEGYELWKDGFEWRVLGEDIDRLNKTGKEFEAVNMEEEAFLKYYNINGDGRRLILSTTEIRSHIERSSSLRINVQKLGVALKGLGLERKGYRKNGVSMRGYEVWTTDPNSHGLTDPVETDQDSDQVADQVADQDYELPF